MTTTLAAGCKIERVDVTVYTVPTDSPEADGTFAWDSTTMVLVEVHAGGHAGLGWTYAEPAVAALIRDKLAGIVAGRDALDVPAAWAAMTGTLRNAVTTGLSAFAVAAVDIALWDLKARLLDVSLAALLGRRREAVPVYGSGGFTSYSDDQLRAQLSSWVEQGIERVKIKVGSDPDADPGRLRVAREAIGPDVELMVDANGAWTPDAALTMAERFAEYDVRWFEEPVSSDDLEGLRRVRDRAPAGMAIAAGEYVTDAYGFRRLLAAEAVDVLQGDATRCGGITGLLRADALCQAYGLPFSAHCSPAVHAPVCTAMQSAMHLEWFHDHARIERLLFDGTLEPDGGQLHPDRGSPGLGIELKHAQGGDYLRDRWSSDPRTATAGSRREPGQA
jgi:L-alanine-DL-glutamate epimerase-like enolase superfamily enzyme